MIKLIEIPQILPRKDEIIVGRRRSSFCETRYPAKVRIVSSGIGSPTIPDAIEANNAMYPYWPTKCKIVSVIIFPL